jgi:ethanolamine utilization protein EutP (predicted NTPase)
MHEDSDPVYWEHVWSHTSSIRTIKTQGNDEKPSESRIDGQTLYVHNMEYYTAIMYICSDIDAKFYLCIPDDFMEAYFTYHRIHLF